jgi:hypothetical protein
MTFPSALPREQPAVVLLLERAQVAQMLAMGEHSRDARFTWLRPSEHNTLRPRENGSCILCVAQAMARLLVALSSACKF